MTSDQTPASKENAPQTPRSKTVGQSLAARDAFGREPPPAARRALAEAAERRRKSEAKPPAATEIGGRGGLDPARYGDWEVKGIASDF